MSRIFRIFKIYKIRERLAAGRGTVVVTRALLFRAFRSCMSIARTDAKNVKGL